MQENEKENLNERVENIKNAVTGKANEFAAEAKDKAENFAGKTLDAVEKLFKKNKSEDAEFEEEKTDPKDIEIAELKKELDELRDKYVRLYADFDNARKRMAKEKLEIILTASKDVLKDLLPVLDDFERAKKALEKSEDVNAVKDGLNLIHTKLVNTLSSKGLKAMETIGKDFDVNQHEAITEMPVPTPDQQGKVIDEAEKGYLLNDKIIRFAKVVVGK